MWPQRASSLLALLALASVAAHARELKEVKAYGSIWELLHSRADLSLFASQIAYFPDLVLFLSDPSLEITMLVPNNRGMLNVWPRGPTQTSELSRVQDFLKSHLKNNDLLYPAAFWDVNAAASRKFDWLQIMAHVFKTPKAMKMAAIKPGQYPSAQALYGWDWNFTFSKLPKRITKGRLVVYDDQVNWDGLTDISNLDFLGTPGNITEADIKAGKSIVHIIDKLFNPQLPPQDAWDRITQAAEDSFQKIAEAARDVFDVDNTQVALTVFLPTDGAISAWLSQQGLTLEQMLVDAQKCAHFVKAHCATRGKASSPALFVHDMIALVAADKYNLSSPDFYVRPRQPGQRRFTHLYNMNGDLLQLDTNFSGITAGDVFVGISPPGPSPDIFLEPSVWARVYTVIDYDGNEAGADGGLMSVVHEVHTVLE